MNKIYGNVNNQNSNISKNQTLQKSKINEKLNKTNDENIKFNDTINISEKNENIINTKKAWDAFKDTCSDIGYIKNDLTIDTDMSPYYCIALDLMEKQGIPVPSFCLDGESNNFLPFIDKLKDFAKELNKTNPGFLPSQFLDFCDAFKEKLPQYGCK
ncbi:hypothetical protein FDC45_19700 [Clostridium botulinum]|uniref:Uncharacterized protein n=1 Tax=Clostridium botulinum TaxID=1491 RepID=A0A846J4T8_CLOBO|nr:hypothetical protein [Clostridium botulinum]ACA56054.1 conserved hypothetical protein [Clostridium botulinum A3 str. Loch Maree]NFH64526.1 hypothetical protein [Clostridium botulinum]NFJ08260.1 hypothetical protein [Clostridium botulinum]NFK16026.1 hypothetical protein [Clostridium botulinum]NFM94589.1 hypothetical protein [Clostridium botulinum]